MSTRFGVPQKAQGTVAVRTVDFNPSSLLVFGRLVNPGTWLWVPGACAECAHRRRGGRGRGYLLRHRAGFPCVARASWRRHHLCRCQRRRWPGVGVLAGRYARSVLQPSGSTTPSPREYSYAASLAVRGMFDAAMRAYADAAAEHPDDPTPWLRGARLLECELKRYEDAADWYRNARDRARAVPGTELLTTRALAELYLRRLAGSRKAAPELQRLLTHFPDTPAATWAREELDAMRAAMLRELHDDP